MDVKTLVTAALCAASCIVANAQTEKKDSVDYNLSLSEVVVKSVAPQTKMKGNAMVTRIQGTVLESAGSAEDMLARVPGIIRMGNSLQVIGKGQPTYYINGRKVQDLEELKRLKSYDIRDVEVINSPGAAYDATVRSVVRIRTRRIQGEGLSGKMEINDAQALQNGNNNLATSVDLNWHDDAIDIFGGVNFQNDYLDNYHSRLEQYTYTKEVNHAQTGTFDASERITQLHLNLGAMWQIDDVNSFGMKVERGQWLHNSFQSVMDEDIWRNGEKENHFLSATDYDSKNPNTFLANVYYNGKIDGWGIDANVDYYWSKGNKNSQVNEKDNNSTTNLNTESDNKSSLFASRLVLDHELWKGNLKLGGEINSLCRDNSYTITGISTIPNNSSKVSEQNYAAFVEYSRFIPKAGMLTLGLRYEHVSFKFDEFDKLNCPVNTLSRTSDEFFPSISFATQVGLMQMSLSYGIKTTRPSYHALRSEVEYVSRYTLQTGNPMLKNEICHNVDLGARWRFVALAVNYLHMKDAIYDWTSPYDDEGTVLIGMVNFTEPINRVSAYVNVSPTFGCWTTSNTIGVQKQWLTFNLADPRTATGQREVSYNKPMYIFNSDNAFRLPHDWQLEINSTFYSKAHYRNAELFQNFWNLTAAVQKSFLKDKSLVVRISCSDIFNTAHHDAGLDLGDYYLFQSNVFGGQRTLYTFQKVNMSIRYSFNSMKRKYKGKGAGEEIIKRI
ncbi:MAG: TonB-dependent receptor domain-containing protein [Prevotella sp.]